MITTPQTAEALAAVVTSHFASTPQEPLIIPNLREDLYRQYPAENVSRLKPMAESARKYRYEADHPKKRTAAMEFGTIVHGLILTPEEVPGLWVKKPFKDFKTKEAQKWRDEQTLIILDDEDLAEMTACAESVKADPKAAWILSRAEKEVAVFKRHERTGLLLKARLDLPFMDLEDRMAVADIKKVVSVKESLFRKDVSNRLGHVQAAFYADIIGASSFYFIGVEEGAPYDVASYRLSSKSLNAGREIYEALLDRVAKCQRENRWPGAQEDSTTVPEIDVYQYAEALPEQLT